MIPSAPPPAAQTCVSAEPVPERHVFNSPAHGAEVQFRGVVRGEESGRALRGLRYSAYIPMARRTLQQIADEVSAAHPGALLFVHHVVGFVAAGEASVLIAVATRHSAEAFSLGQEILRRLKSEVPVWKEPVFSDAPGTTYSG